jgi:hypothetical protein
MGLSDTLAAVLERDPDWTALPSATPAHLHDCSTGRSKKTLDAGCAILAMRRSAWCSRRR